jgi:hypothetical protein
LFVGALSDAGLAVIRSWDVANTDSRVQDAGLRYGSLVDLLGLGCRPMLHQWSGAAVAFDCTTGIARWRFGARRAGDHRLCVGRAEGVICDRRTLALLVVQLTTALPGQLDGILPAAAAQSTGGTGSAITPYHPPTGGPYVDPKPFTASMPSPPVPRIVTNGPDSKAPKGYVEGVSREMPLARTETGKVYANPDGTFTAFIYSAPINWAAGEHNWLPIDDTLVKASDGGYTNKSGPVGVHFAKSAASDSLVQFTAGGTTVAFGAPVGARAVVPTISGSTIRYRGVYPNADVEYHVGGHKVKEFLILNFACRDPALPLSG